MELEPTHYTAQTSGVQSEGFFGISENDQVHVISILRDKLYSNKVLAVIREYSTNAFDENPPGQPIEVTLPTKFAPEFTVRDFGKGLTEEEIRLIYTQYGRSTKRESNTAIGQLGLGSKSAFAYGETFTIISWKDGVRSDYLAYLDETGRGKYSKLREQPSTDPSGILIKIPVNLNDIYIFKNTAEYFFKYWTVKPILHGGTIPPLSIWLSGKTNWFITKDTAPVAVMGNIAYPIEVNKLNLTKYAAISGKPIQGLDTLLNTSLCIAFDIGDLSITASREGLEYTEKTQKALIARLESIRDEIIATLKETLDTCTTIWQARQWFLKNHNTPLARAISLGQNGLLSWQGRPINITWLPYRNGNFKARLLRYGSSTLEPLNKRNPTYGEVSLQESLAIIKPDVTNWRARIINERNYGRLKTDLLVYILDKEKAALYGYDLDQQITEYCKEYDLTGIPIIAASSLPDTDMVLGDDDPTEVSDKFPAGPSEAKKKAVVKTFTLKPNFNPRCHPASANWDPATIDLQTDIAVYLVIHAFQPQSSSSDEVWSALVTLQLLGHDFAKIPVYGIRKDQVSKLGPGMKEFLPWAKERIVQLLSTSPHGKSIKDYLITQSLNNLRHFYVDSELQKFCNLRPDIGRLVYFLRDSVKSYQDLSWDLKSKISSLYNGLSFLENDALATLFPIPELSEIKIIKQKYPLLRILRIFDGSNIYASDWAEHLNQYLNLLDTTTIKEKEEELC